MPLFKCKGHCKFKDCNVKSVCRDYSGNLKYKVTEQQARPIKVFRRGILKESFSK